VESGFAHEALQKARRDLPAGEGKVFGLSNVLMLLNGLLKYRHPDFTNHMLDEIEHLTHDLNEHTFMIPGKIAAIRAGRLRATGELTPNHTIHRTLVPRPVIFLLMLFKINTVSFKGSKGRNRLVNIRFNF